MGHLDNQGEPLFRVFVRTPFAFAANHKKIGIPICSRWVTVHLENSTLERAAFASIRAGIKTTIKLAFKGRMHSLGLFIALSIMVNDFAKRFASQETKRHLNTKIGGACVPCRRIKRKGNSDRPFTVCFAKLSRNWNLIYIKPVHADRIVRIKNHTVRV